MLGAEMQSASERPETRGPGHLAWVVVTLAALGLWLVLRDTGPCDDEYIVWRYARNLLQTGALCFNPYETHPVEGFTCPLWVLLIASGMVLKIPPLLLSGVFGLLSVCAASWAALLARGRERRESDFWCALAIALGVPLAYHAALAAALVAGWYVLLRRERGVLAGLALGAATLLRPELLVLLPFHAYAARRAAAWLAAALLPLAWLAFRRESFGEWLPMTYYVKKLPLAEDLRFGAAYLWQATLDTGIGVVLVLLVLARPGGRVTRTALAGAVAVCAGVVWVGGDYMFLARFFVPLLPLVLLLAADALAAFELTQRSRVRAAWIALVLLQLWPVVRLGELRESQRFYEQRWIAIGKELAAHAPFWTLATSPIGAIGWYSHLPIVDMLGITNDALRHVEPDLAITLKGHQRHDARWVLDQQPDAIVLGNGISPRGERSLDVNAWEKELYLDARFQTGYQARLLPIPGQTSLVYFQRVRNTIFDWPIPAGWKREVLPFPLDFAPELPYRGLEELRFMPGFFTPSAPDFWSYDFVWWLEDAPAFDAPTLSVALTKYFRGLALSVGKDKYSFDPQRFRAELAPRSAGSETILAGDVWSYDPFATGKELVLHVEASLKRCPRAGRNALLFLVTPKPTDDPVWAELRACAALWHCPD
jgi:hypothetical protein